MQRSAPSSNRYSAITLHGSPFPDITLAQQTVTGLYDLRDPDRALRALVQPHGGKVHEVSRFARIVSRL